MLWPFSSTTEGGLTHIASESARSAIVLSECVDGTRCDALTAISCSLLQTLVRDCTGALLRQYAYAPVAPAALPWLYPLLEDLFVRCAARLGCRLIGIAEEARLQTYGPGGHVDWHHDAHCIVAYERKVSLSIQLSPSEAYRGGDLEFRDLELNGCDARARGSAIAFPSQAVHRVSAVIHGARSSLVAWAYG